MIFHPKHEYTKKLWQCKAGGETICKMIRFLLEVKNLNKTFPVKKEKLYAVSDVSFSSKKGECLGIVGESGGKSTVARMTPVSYPCVEKYCWKGNYMNLKGSEKDVSAETFRWFSPLIPLSSFSPLNESWNLSYGIQKETLMDQ